ncbi:MAG: class I SAM-dependent methyltransferase [Deltaproteobacteria bacterium]|nr:class I SAM-dependent methyltransferase [Deltaproteobacteria bacterium]
MSPAHAPLAPVYDAAFYDAQEAGSLRSARVVVPLVLDLVQPSSVLDVGCGLGTWLSAVVENGVTDVLGLDGAHVDRSRLKIPDAHFRPTDLRQVPALGRGFELAMCLEVVEHLPSAASERIVDLLTQAAPAVLFSAALPGQGGRRHINERWPEHWERLFSARGFVRLDPIRPRVWRHREVEWWYQQNLFLFVREGHLERHPALRAERDLARDFRFELVQERAFRKAVGARFAWPGQLWRAVRRSFG